MTYSDSTDIQDDSNLPISQMSTNTQGNFASGFAIYYQPKGRIVGIKITF